MSSRRCTNAHLTTKRAAVLCTADNQRRISYDRSCPGISAYGFAETRRLFSACEALLRGNLNLLGFAHKCILILRIDQEVYREIEVSKNRGKLYKEGRHALVRKGFPSPRRGHEWPQRLYLATHPVRRAIMRILRYLVRSGAVKKDGTWIKEHEHAHSERHMIQ
jgi:hypothetical protein